MDDCCFVLLSVEVEAFLIVALSKSVGCMKDMTACVLLICCNVFVCNVIQMMIIRRIMSNQLTIVPINLEFKTFLVTVGDLDWFISEIQWNLITFCELYIYIFNSSCVLFKYHL